MHEQTEQFIGPHGTLWTAFKGNSGQCHDGKRRGFTGSLQELKMPPF